MARSSNLARSSRATAAQPAPREPEFSTGTTGGPVGQMLAELDARMALHPARMPYHEVPEDIFHTISIVAGYVGLAVTFAGSIAFISWLGHFLF